MTTIYACNKTHLFSRFNLKANQFDNQCNAHRLQMLSSIALQGLSTSFSVNHKYRKPEFLTRAVERRDGDLGENAGESFFPTSDTELSCEGVEIPTEPIMRIGHGWDIHRLAAKEEAGQGCVIGGVEIPDFDLGTIAHSDGDVLYHSATDALLGALGLPDIGQLFPDNDPRWRGADSEAFFDEAVRLMVKRGYRISNLDVTLILEKPRVAKHKPAMKDNVVRICKTIPARVNIKARTHEKLDSIGEGRALSCHTFVIMERV
eukprot:CAMPEP_0196587288 /NCGR_PEP_ID=MMETSP1081-20130531/57025_1 /TAXON_ID=36882 /ORGANISM="Pyramimonas amylifera, Strain CCMP720" /LENGTH=260 /DNA_ID=CAMNT_0041909433 /DNA_START=35 /DNA_END=817 /DNA_ORIENTATION=+